MSAPSDKPHCVTTLDRLNAYVDRELTEAEMAEVRRHLDDCPPCAHYFHLQEQMKLLVRKGCPEHAPQTLLTRVLENLRRG